MFKKNKYTGTSIQVNEAVEGETIEQKLERIIANKEPISEGSVEMLYTDRNEGVIPAYDPRTDKFDLAIEAMDKVTKASNAKREAKMNIVKNDEPTSDSTNSTTSLNQGGESN